MSKKTQFIAAFGVVAALGMIAVPLTHAAEEEVTITASVDGTVGMSVSNNNVNLGTLLAGGDPKTAAVTVSVNSTDENGYHLTIKDSDSNTALVHLGANGLPDTTADKIEAGVPAQGSSLWGYNAGEGFKAVTTSDVKIASKDEAGSGDTTITFGASAASGLTSGTYQGGVIITATAGQ